MTEQFPYRSAGSIVAELKGTSVIRVALISAVPSVGQPGLFCGPRRGQGPSSWWQPSPGSGAGRWDTLALGAPMSRAPQPMTSSREGGTGVSLAAAHLLGIPRQPCSSHCHCRQTSATNLFLSNLFCSQQLLWPQLLVPPQWLSSLGLCCESCSGRLGSLGWQVQA